MNIVHLSTVRGLEAVRAARKRGQKVYAETCPQYLLLSEQPAKLFGMYPQKGALSVGSDADIVIFDPEYTGRITAA